MAKFILEGIDRLGKSTLAKSIQDQLGYHLVIHYDKPQMLNCYRIEQRDPLRTYQEEVNVGMFTLIEQNIGTPIIFDRGHLGECVYAPLYRNYSGDYVFQIESQHDTSDAKLILLTTSNFDICVDDGESFNFNNKEKEQQLFIEAFNKSRMSKVLIDVYNPDTGTFKDPELILQEALKK